jgi:hypothetical protein
MAPGSFDLTVRSGRVRHPLGWNALFLVGWCAGSVASAGITAVGSG